MVHILIGEMKVPIKNEAGVRFRTSMRGRAIAVYHGNRFNLKHPNKEGIRKKWRCTKWSSGCRASLSTEQDQVVTDNLMHNHLDMEPHHLDSESPEQVMERAKKDLSGMMIQFIESRRGNTMLVCGGFRFSLKNPEGSGKKIWRCVKWSAGCRACLYTMKGEVVMARIMHNHL